MPLKKFEPDYYQGKTPKTVEVPEDETVVEYAYDSAVEQAKETKVLDAFVEALKNIVHIYIWSSCRSSWL
ncbi:MAG: hypothetical protein U5K84_02605 [Alkalibacterium sp.]|nr:hypothetical protein [Alkalibacterium sp.]